MKWNKLLVLGIVILSISIVVFNNLTQIMQTLFAPTFQMRFYLGFLMCVLGITIYAVLNKNLLKGKVI